MGQRGATGKGGRMKVSYERKFCAYCKDYTVHENMVCVRHKEEMSSITRVQRDRFLEIKDTIEELDPDVETLQMVQAFIGVKLERRQEIVNDLLQ